MKKKITTRPDDILEGTFETYWLCSLFAWLSGLAPTSSHAVSDDFSQTYFSLKIDFCYGQVITLWKKLLRCNRERLILHKNWSILWDYRNHQMMRNWLSLDESRIHHSQKCVELHLHESLVQFLQVFLVILQIWGHLTSNYVQGTLILWYFPNYRMRKIPNSSTWRRTPPLSLNHNPHPPRACSASSNSRCVRAWPLVNFFILQP